MKTPRVLSIIESYIGHQTYGQLMRDYFQRATCKVDFYWYNEERELHARLLNRLLSYYSSNRWVQRQNIDLFLFRYQIGFAYMGRRLAVRKLAQADYTALHFHTQPLAFLCRDLMRKYPTIISIDRTTWQAAREYTDPQFYWTFSPNIHLERQVFEAAQTIVSFSESARQSVIQDYAIAPEKVKVVYPGVDIDKIAPAQGDLVQKPCDILFIGGDFDRKGGQDVLAVFLEQFADQARLHLVTKDPIACDHPNVHVYHNINAYTPEWLGLYHTADLFVMPTYSEPFGWVFIEAMAAGLPIVATRLNAIPEMVTPGENGLLIEPGDRAALAQSIQYLIDHPERRREMGSNGRRLVEQRFNTQLHFEQLETLLQAAVS
jgi:glycosyltransferase involved in cell wall biosynthesis